MRHLFAAYIIVMSAAIAFTARTSITAQTLNPDPCTAPPAGTTYTVTSGRPFKITFVVPDKAPASATDPTLVPNRISGFFIDVDDPNINNNVGWLSPSGAACPAGSTFAGMLPYEYTLQGVSRGNHQVYVSAWNYALDANGAETTTRQESELASVPFAAADPVLIGPPAGPRNVLIGIK